MGDMQGILFLTALIVTCYGATETTSEAKLYDAEQSTTNCLSDGVTCNKASYAINGNSNMVAVTASGYGTHWWQASMPNTTVHTITMKASTSGQQNTKITVALYSKGAVVGTCETYSPSTYTESKTVDCDKVPADKVKLSATPSDQYDKTKILLYSITVTGVVHEVIKDDSEEKKPSAGVSYGPHSFLVMCTVAVWCRMLL